MRLLLLSVFLMFAFGLQQTSAQSVIPSTPNCLQDPKQIACLIGKPINIKGLPPNIPGMSRPIGSLAKYCRENPNTKRCVEWRARTQAPTQLAGAGLNLPASWHFADPHPDALVAINFGALRRSPTAENLWSQIVAALNLDTSLVSSLSQLGELDQIWLTVHGGDVLVLAQGHLRVPDGFVRLTNDLTCWRISSTAAVFGRQNGVADAVDRLSSAVPASSPKIAVIRALMLQNDVSMVASRELVTANAMPIPGYNAVTGFSAAFALRDGLKLEARVDFANAPAARQTFAIFGRDQKGSPVHITPTLVGSSVRLALVVPQSELSSAVETALNGPAGKQLSNMARNLPRAQGQVSVQSPSGNSEQVTAGGETFGGSGLIRSIQGGEVEPQSAKTPDHAPSPQ